MPSHIGTLEQSAMADNKSKTPFYLIDTQSEFYRPAGRRGIICAAVALWAVLETWHRDPFWSVISIAAAVYCFYVLFWTYKPPVPPPVRAPDPDEDEENIEIDDADMKQPAAENEDKLKS
jgi:hypothetical protein